jgi:circadian clock protein KaiC
MTVMLTDLKKGEMRERTEETISSLVDTWLVLRDIESNGERNRGLHILKSRGMAHSNQVREFFLSDTGVQIADVYSGPNGMLTGSARVAQEARDRAEHVSLNEEAQRQKLALECKRAALEAQIAAQRAEFAAEEASVARIFSQDKQREASVALDRVAMGRSRQNDAVKVKSNGSPARRNVKGGKRS